MTLVNGCVITRGVTDGPTDAQGGERYVTVQILSNLVACENLNGKMLCVGTTISVKHKYFKHEIYNEKRLWQTIQPVKHNNK